MTHDTERATLLNTEVRGDALHVFISGLKKSLRAVVFSAQSKDLPAALALAREAEASIDRCTFAATYAKAVSREIRILTSTRANSEFPRNKGNI